VTATATGRPRATGSRRGVGIVALAALGLLAIALVTGRPDPDLPPLDPRSHQPDGASALVALLRALDVEVELGIGLPTDDDDVALLLGDRLTRSQRDELLGWVERGGRLVLADPSSPLAPGPASASDALGAGLSRGVDPGPVDPGTCGIDALQGVGPLEPGQVVALEVPDGADGCFGTSDAALVVADPRGDGVVVSLGAPGALVNGRLDRAGNAAAAAALIGPAPGTAVRVVDPPSPVGDGDATLADLVPDGVTRALLQLGVAFVAYAAWRAIRLGRPVDEPQPVALAGSELVSATGRLLAATGSPAAAAEALRAGLRHDLGARLGLAPDLHVDRVTAAVVERTGLDATTLGPALGPDPVRTDDELVAAARAVAIVRQEAL
jgi:hypothetical protein